MKTLIILTLAGVMTTAHAQRWTEESGKAGDGGGWGRNLRTMLKLDDATSAKIEQLRNDHQKNVIALRAKMKTARVDFRSLMTKDTPDESALLSKQKEISGISGELEVARLQHRLAVGKLLTPEQKKLMATEGKQRGRAHRRGDLRKHRQESPGSGSCCR